ncbi:MAG: TrmB family transcriptional regulator [Euryarchaeota archaeon]|nr:TrmB family transcriptional regulator [Euryarchaeota archaeon]
MTSVIKHLVRLGLSEYEARAYVATVSLGEGTISEISRESGIPRSRTYDVMERLARKGFVEMGNTAPKCYRANDPLTASDRLMEEFRRANEEVVKGLRDVGKRADKRINPVWTLTGSWAIEHKIEELLESSEEDVSFVFLNRSSPLRYGALIAKKSQKKNITVVLAHRLKNGSQLLGNTRIMMLQPIPGMLSEVEGTLCDDGFVTGDDCYCIEMIMVVDQDVTLLLTNENDEQRAIIIHGTVLNIFGHDAVRKLIEGAKEIDDYKG